MNAVTPLDQPLGNIEAEAQLLAGLMAENKLVDSIADKLAPEDFCEEFYGHVFGLMVKEHSLGHAVNPITLRPHLTAEGFQAVAALGGSAVSALGAKSCADQIADYAKRRRLIENLSGVIASAQAWDTPVPELVEAADAAIVEAVGEAEGSNTRSAAQCIGDMLYDLEQGHRGVTSGCIPSLDKALGPIRPSDLVILAARPGMGKTAAALSYAIGASRAGHGVLFVSLEMGAAQLGGRIAADMLYDTSERVPYHFISSGDLHPTQSRRVARAAQEADSLPFQVEDIARLTIGRLNMLVRRHARRFAARGQKLELVMVDYLQLVRPDHREASTYAAVSEVSRGLKEIAKTHGVGVLALAQLSREVEKRQDKRPQLSDLRDSGQIEQDADAVLFLYREEYYLKQAEPQPDDPKRGQWEDAMAAASKQIEFICAKRRAGTPGKEWGEFDSAYQAVRG